MGGDGRVSRFAIDGESFAVISRPRRDEEVEALLTPAEREVYVLLRDGLSNAAIAELRRTSERTVANQARAIYAKLGVNGRRDLVLRPAD